MGPAADQGRAECFHKRLWARPEKKKKKKHPFSTGVFGLSHGVPNAWREELRKVLENS